MANTSAAAANSSSSKKAAVTSSDNANIIKLRDITANLLKMYFPILSNAPNILYVTMATWGFESAFHLLHKKGRAPNPVVIDSQHPGSGGSIGAGTLIGSDYLDSAVIRNLRNNPNTSFQVLANIRQGQFAHGLSACMGCYHVRGTKAFSYMFKPHLAMVEELGLAVNPGESITALFPDNDAGRMRSIAAGLIVYDQKYKAFLRKGLSPSEALNNAVIAYVGNPKARDSNNFSPISRLNQVQGKRAGAGEQSILDKLAAAGLSSDDTSIGVNSAAISKYGPNSSMQSLGGSASNNSNRGGDTSSQSPPSNPPGCSG